MRGSEPYPHVGVNARHEVEQVGEAQASLFGSVDGAEAAAQLGPLRAAELNL